MSFRGIDRVALVVRDMDAAVAFFSKIFHVGFDVIDDDLEQIRVAHARDKFGLELVSPMSPDSRLGAHLTELLAQKGECVDVVVVRVDDLDEAVEEFRKAGLEPFGLLDHGDMREAMYDPSHLFGLPLILNDYVEPHPCSVAARAYLESRPEA